MKVDMSAEAVTARLRRVSELRRLCLALGKARPVEPGGTAQRAPKPKGSDGPAPPEGGPEP